MKKHVLTKVVDGEIVEVSLEEFLKQYPEYQQYFVEAGDIIEV